MFASGSHSIPWARARATAPRIAANAPKKRTCIATDARLSSKGKREACAWWLREQLAVQDFSRLRIILRPPWLIARLSRRQLQLQFLSRFFRFGLRDAKFVMIEEPHRFDCIGNGDPPIANHEQVLAVRSVSRA